MIRVAIYARFSSEKQNSTSADDQVRRARELAERHGFVVCEDLIFVDAAVSGTDKGDTRRTAYKLMLQAWHDGKFDVLIVESIDRLSRDAVEQAKLLKRLDNDRRVRLLTADGIDTLEPDWPLRLGLQGVLAQHEIRKLGQRVNRGMEGQLVRGFMIAPPPYGYDLQRQFDGRDQHIGSHWIPNAQDAAIVREVFARRESGYSMHQIAAWLNSEGILCARRPHTPGGGHWRPARVKAMLDNAIYRGVFVLHGSAAYRASMKKRGLPVDIKEFPRPQLRLVSDETWFSGKSRAISRSGYGGGKHALGGLLTCGYCAGTMAVSALRACRSLYCPTCSEAKSSKADEARLTSSVAVAGVQHLLKHALRYFVSPPFVEAFRNSLQLRLTGDSRAEVEACRKRLSKFKADQERLSHMLVSLTQDDEVLMRRYEESREKAAKTQARLDELLVGFQELDARAMQAQLESNPLQALDTLFEADVPPHQLRAVLARLFPSIVFKGKHSRRVSQFRIRFAPGVAFSMASGTQVLSDTESEAQFILKYHQHTLKTEAHWTVDRMDP